MDGEELNRVFREMDGWQVFASGQASGKVSRSEGGGLRLEYDFGTGTGFVAMRKVVDWRLPESYRFGFRVKGEGEENHLEFKLSDKGGENAWRWTGEGVADGDGMEVIRIDERDLPYAWGPSGGGAAREVGAVEWVVVAGPGGKGFVEIGAEDFTDETLRPPFAVSCSSADKGTTAAGAMDGGGWMAGENDARAWWAVDFGRSARFGGVVLHWMAENLCDHVVLEGSENGKEWIELFVAHGIRGALTFAPVKGGEARHVRLVFSGGRAALRRIEWKPDGFSSSPNEFIHHVAEYYPRGCFPRYWYREQSYWTTVGSPWGGKRALINEEGMVEADEGSFSLEPFVEVEGKWISWTGAHTTPGMPRSGVPMPFVSWHGKGWSLRVMPWMTGRDTRQALRVGYELRPGGKVTRFAVAVRPYQVNPPWQAFRDLGGVARNHCVAEHVEGMLVDGWRIVCEPVPQRAGGLTSAGGGLPGLLICGEGEPDLVAEDPAGLASGMMIWDVDSNAPVVSIQTTIPYLETGTEALHLTGRERSARSWRGVLEQVKWRVPPEAAGAVHAWRTAAGHILINRDGAAIQPGPRRYTRSWVRDCVIMGAALAKAGRVRPLRDFLVWYSGFQRADGFVPCVVDRDGVDWLVEHDSHGQFLWGIREAWRFGAGKHLVVSLWNHIRLAAEILITLRAERLTEEYQGGACHGLLPESASHEGYLAHHVHSYWDDFWGVRGLEAASELADLIGKGKWVSRWREEAAAFEKDVLSSMNMVIHEKSLDYLPGSVEWADYDPTATANAVAMLDFARVLPHEPLRAMFRKYLDDFRRNHGEDGHWKNYTAYEIRIIGAMVRLGMREEANELLDFFLGDRRPVVWNQWPEISWRDKNAPGHLGDLPHTWISAEYVLAFAAMFADEREADDSLVLAAGVRESWASAGFSIVGLPTRWGTLDFSMKKEAGGFFVKVGGALQMPPGGLWLHPPGGGMMRIGGLPWEEEIPIGKGGWG